MRTDSWSVGRRAWRWLLLVLLAAGCAAGTDRESDGPQVVSRPEWRVGDRWVFRRVPVSGAPAVVTVEVVAAGPEGYQVRSSGVDGMLVRQWTLDLQLQAQADPGGTVRFDPPLPFFRWPLRLGETWTETAVARHGSREELATRTWRVGTAIELVDVVAGTFFTLRIEELSGDGRRLAAYWYTPLVRSWVRFQSYEDGSTEELLEWRRW